MEYKIYFQDPTTAETVYLFEAIIEAVQNATAWDGVFAFASRAGIDSLIIDPTVIDFMQIGSLSLIVGIDAVTNRETLERFRELEDVHESLNVRVFWNNSSALFHPKVSRFRYADGSQSVIAGSGNLTPGGLRDNFEAFSVVRTRPRERIDFASWDSFVRNNSAELRKIDNEALERAARNLIRSRRGGARRRIVEPETVEAAVEGLMESRREHSPRHSNRVLVAQIPAAGGRWHQGHFNRDVVDQFFRVQSDSPQRVFLTWRRADGTTADQEVRLCVYSHTNKNFKIELAARREETYPASGRPVAIFREDQVRTFEYMLLMPGETGNDEMIRLTAELPTVGRGLPRVITDKETVQRYWEECPLF